MYLPLFPHKNHSLAMLHGYVTGNAYRVSDTYRIRIRVRYSSDTYPQSIRFFLFFANIGYGSRYVSGLRIRLNPIAIDSIIPLSLTP